MSIDCGFAGTPFSVTLELPGERLSTIVGENETLESLSFMEEYGATLARLHQLSVRAEMVKDRRFFHAPPDKLLKILGLEECKGYFANPPKGAVQCFCHGDFHYANILWNNHHISGILDFELAGYGNRDFDIAWALFRRPGQKFMKTEAEQESFLCGYQQVAPCDRAVSCAAISRSLHATARLLNTTWPNAMYTFCNSAETTQSIAIIFAPG